METTTMQDLLPQYKAKIEAQVDPRKYHIQSLVLLNNGVYASINNLIINAIYIVSANVIKSDIDAAVKTTLSIGTGGAYHG